MTINQKISKMHKGKTYTLCDGVDGKGQNVWIIYTENSQGSVHSETFKNYKECKAWWEHSCN